MVDQATPWVTAAWQHWHRPWAVMHPTWIEPRHASYVGDMAQEPLLRLHYPAWCQAYGLDTRLTGFQDAVWWRLFGLPTPACERAAHLVGWTLLYAADPARRLMRRGPSLDLAAARWALGRSHFVPAPVLDWVQSTVEGAPADHLAEQVAAVTLRSCVPDEAPALWPRLRMRLARPPHRDQDEPLAMPVHAQMHIASLWGGAVRHVAPGAATGHRLPDTQEVSA